MRQAHALEVISYSIDESIYNCLFQYFSSFSDHAECFANIALILMRDALKANVLRVLSLEQNINPGEELQYCVALLEFRSQHRPDIERFFSEKFRKHRLHVRLTIIPEQNSICLCAENAFALFDEEKSRITAKLAQARDFRAVFSFFEESDLLQNDELRDRAASCLDKLGVKREAYRLQADAPSARSELDLPLSTSIAPNHEREIFDFRS